jgi:hypothetical protein
LEDFIGVRAEGFERGLRPPRADERAHPDLAGRRAVPVRAVADHQAAFGRRARGAQNLAQAGRMRLEPADIGVAGARDDVRLELQRRELLARRIVGKDRDRLARGAQGGERIAGA